MKNLLTLVLSLLTTASLFAQNSALQQNKIRIDGHITGLEDMTIQFYYSLDGESKNDSIFTKAGKFSWEGQLNEPQKVYIVFPNRYFEFYAEPGTLKLTGTADALNALKVTGSRLLEEANAYQATLKNITDQESILYQQHGKGTDAEQRELEEKLQQFRIQKRERANAYVKANPNSRYSLSLVEDRAAMGAYEDIQPLFNLLSAEMRETHSGRRLAERLDVLKRSAIGAEMLDFTQNDMDGKPVRFNEFRGQYVLVDFWASWCGPCRAENPNVLKEYNKYKDNGFTVVGVSLDDNAERWKKAVADDGMPWTQLSDLQGWKNEVSTYYGIQGIPSTLLVDPNGVIIAKDLRGELLAKKLEEIFNEKI